METLTRKEGRKARSFEFLKLFATCLIVFLHVSFPGTLGNVLRTMRFRTPFFFALSGYFSYQISSRRLLKRMRHICILILVSNIICATYGATEYVYLSKWTYSKYFSAIFSAKKVARFLFFNIPLPTHSFHLWYLSAILTCYIIFWFYTKLKENDGIVDYRPLYIVSASLLMIFILCDTKLTGTGLKIDYVAYRNGLFFGLPLFCTGLFIRENREKIIRVFNLTLGKEFIIFIITAASGYFQYTFIGKAEMPIGSFIAVCAILLLGARIAETESPSPLKDVCAHVAGKCSLVIYVTHIVVYYTIKAFAQKSDFWAGIFAAKGTLPLVVLAISFILGLLFIISEQCCKQLLNKT